MNFDLSALSENSPWIFYEILVNVPIKDFPKLCSSNKEISQICSGNLSKEQELIYTDKITERLYKERAEKFFGEDIMKFREENMSFKEFYERIVKLYNNKVFDTKLANNYAETGKLLELKILFSIPPPKGPIIPDRYGVIYAAANGDVNILEWMKVNNISLPHQEGANMAAAHGRKNVLEWIKENNLTLPDQHGANNAAGNGQINVLNWMKLNTLPQPNQQGAIWAAGSGHVNVLDWMKENRLELPNQDAANSAAAYGYINVLEWMKQNGLPLPNQLGAKWATDAGRRNVLEWMKNNNLPIN